MQVTSLRGTGNAAQLTLTEWITVGDISFTAEMNGHVSPAGFIVLNGTVTEGSFAGAQVHQRSNLVGGNEKTTEWTGELPQRHRRRAREPDHRGGGGAGLDPCPSPAVSLREWSRSSVLLPRRRGRSTKKCVISAEGGK